jgi:hypothetical protein
MVYLGVQQTGVITIEKGASMPAHPAPHTGLQTENFT